MAARRKTATAKVAERAEKIKGQSVIKKVPLGQIKADASYQREPNQALVDLIASEWDVVASELVLISDRGPRAEDAKVDGGLFIVNGQHRVLAARKVGEKEIDARVINLRREPEPAKIEAAFRLKTNVRRGDHSAERFKAQIVAGDEDTIAIVKLLARFDTEINITPNLDSGINAVAAVEKLYALDEGVVLQETLEILRDAYQVVSPKNANSNMLKGVAWFIEKHSMQVNRNRLIEKLRTITLAQLDAKARIMRSTMGGSGWVNYYRVLVELYNDNLKSQKAMLDWSTRGATSQRGGAFGGDRAGDAAGNKG